MTGDISRCHNTRRGPGQSWGRVQASADTHGACAEDLGEPPPGWGGSGSPGQGRGPQQRHTCIFLYSFLHSSVHPSKVRRAAKIQVYLDYRPNFQWQGLGQSIRVSETNTSCSGTVKIPLNARITLLVTRNANFRISTVYDFSTVLILTRKGLGLLVTDQQATPSLETSY